MPCRSLPALRFSQIEPALKKNDAHGDEGVHSAVLQQGRVTDSENRPCEKAGSEKQHKNFLDLEKWDAWGSQCLKGYALQCIEETS